MRLLRRASYRRSPWKNGKGLTEEIRAAPEGQGLDGFDWRVSLAHVGGDGRFSLFPGVDRTIVLIEGQGLALDLPDGGTVALEPGGPGFSFPGEWAIWSRNRAGPTMDLNVMTRRGRFSHRLERRSIAAGEAVAMPATSLAVFQADASVRLDGTPQPVGRLDAVLFEEAATLEVGGEATPVILIGIEPA